MRRWPGVTVSAAMSAVYLVVLIPAQDYASGAFRAHLASSGAWLWNNMWFGGHPLPAYGMLSARLAGWLGVRTLAALSTVVSVWGFSRLLQRAQIGTRTTERLAEAVFAMCVGINMWAGRLTFAPSIAFAMLCLLALQSDRRIAAPVASCACALSSPVGAVFLLAVLTALWWNRWKRASVAAAAVAAGVPLLILLGRFSEGGWFPFRWQNLLMIGVGVSVVLVCARHNSLVRSTALVYTVIVIVAFVVKSPLGGNVVRLGWIAAGPVAVLFIPRHRRLALVAVVIFAVVWNGVYLPFDRSLTTASARESFYRPVAAFIGAQPGVHKVEVLPTDTRLESDVLAEFFPLARGWQTQIDRGRNGIFYSGDLTVQVYEEWLRNNAVSFVAVPKNHLHAEARDEASVITEMGDQLVDVFSDGDWSIYKVRDATPLATNGATVTAVSAEQIHVSATRAGMSELRFRYTPLYEVATGDACVSTTDDGWIRLLVKSPGEITLRVRLSVDGLVGRRTDCD